MGAELWYILQVNMSSSHIPGKEVATSSNRKRVRSGNVPPAPTSQRLSLKKERFDITSTPRPLIFLMYVLTGTIWHEFYANWAPEVRSHFVTVHGKNVPITPTCINDILGTPQDTDPLVLTGLNIRPPYQSIRHMLYGPQSMAQWTKHSGKRYHKSLPYAHMLRETHVWLKLNIGAIIKSSIRKVGVHKRHRYAFGCLITKMCRVAGVPEENLDYMAPLYPAPVDITHTKRPDTNFDPTLTTAKHHRRDELIMARMYSLEMLRHKTGGQPSTDLEIGEVNRRYLLNDHAKALLAIGPEFREPTENDIPTDEENLRTGSDVESDSDKEIDPIQAEAEADGGDIMED
ncbi:hypothetical protein H5410_013017 [Solanum commersonii]|uniref:Putative plant transposon protein domain-containing protein n=1 Tax=Solanum commersonii TaxID=4109 RepID=A0A9J6AUH5_SOLCO|nr:hypothetical protein H5410_013017 [Solanum commersonii]